MINFKTIRSLTIVLIFVSGLDLKAQEDTATSILSFEEKLVEIAIKNNPDVEILLNNQNIAKYNMQKSRWNWMNQLQVQGNMNEFTLNETAAGSQAAFYPRYNISLTVPLGIFGTRANEVRIAKQEFESSDYELMKKQIEIRKQVLTLYGNYLLYQELITIQIQRTEDEYVFYKTVEDQFSNQQATMAEFKSASNSYNMELEKKYMLTFEQKEVLIALESLLGMPLEMAEKQINGKAE